VEAVILEEIEKIAGEGITERELQKAKNRRLADHWRGLQSNMGIARGLTYYQSVIGDWRYMLRYLEQVEATTGEDIQRVVREYLTEKNRTAATLVKVSPRD
jgi:zinc protease